jgi:CHAT domain-containing protein/tetratricopeptide (TPR) repeat protein
MTYHAPTLSIVLLFFQSICFGQGNTKKGVDLDSLKTGVYEFRYDRKEKVEHYRRLISYIDALEKNDPDCKEKWEAQNLLTEYHLRFRQLDSAAFLSEKSIAHRLECADKTALFEAYFNSLKYFYALGAYPECDRIYQEIIRQSLRNHANFYRRVQITAYYLAVLLELENYSDCYVIGSREVAVLQDSQHVEPNVAGFIVSSSLVVANAAMRLRKFELASEVIEQTIRYQQQFCPNDMLSSFRIEEIIGWFHFDKKEYQKANKQAIKAIENLQNSVSSEDPNFRNEFISANIIVGETYTWIGKPQTGKHFLKTALALYGDNTKRNAFLGNIHLKLADAYAALNMGPAAIRQDDSAYVHYRKALYHFTDLFEPNNEKMLIPEESDLSTNFRLVRVCLNNFTKLLLRTARRDGRAADWQYAYLAERLAVISLEDMRNRVGPDSRFILAELGRDTYEQAIALAFEMAEAQPHADSLYAIAFEWAEAAKSFELRMNLQEAEAALQANAPDSLVRQGNRLKLARNYYENKYETMRKNPEVDSLDFEKTETAFQDAQLALLAWEQKMEKLIPAGLGAKDDKPLSAKDIQRLLKPDEALLSFFYGDSAVYPFWARPDGLRAHRIGDAARVDSLVRNLLTVLYQRGNLADFVLPARELYTAVLGPIPDRTVPASLLICLDGLLGYVPFSCLLTEDIAFVNLSASYAQRELPYLQKIQSPRYAYGASLHFQSVLAEQVPRSKNAGLKRRKAKLAAFAPKYEKDLSLAFNGPQAEAIAALWGGDLFSGGEAREPLFRSLLERYAILHLAQHGEANLEQPFASRLHFTTSVDTVPERDGFLHAYEIYALDISTQIVVLASCESGYGPLAKGEGVMSLARAFRAAGAKTVVNTAWEVDGRVALPLMQLFYEKLAIGKLPSEALIEAKREFLQTAPPELIHPYYWAAFTLIGSDTPLRRPQSGWLFWSCFLLLVGLGGLALTGNRNV